jgi:tetratricopeptide (TPR) repeat protein
MQRDSRQLTLSLAAAAAGFVAIYFLSGFLASAKPPLPEGFADRDLALQGAKLKNYSLGFNGLLADWYWMQTLQYIGDKVIHARENVNIDDLRPLNPRLMYPMLENATDLDPQFLAAYSFGAVVLPAVDAEQAIRITEKGIANNPDQWRLYQHLGFIYWRLKQYDKAAAAYEEGAKIEGAPGFFTMMVAQMRSQGGSRETARAIYEQLRREADDDRTREIAELRLLELDSLDERDAVRNILTAFAAQNKRCPASWSEIFPQLRSVKLPRGREFRVDRENNLVDPTGAPYRLTKDRCDIGIDAERSKIPAEAP